MKKRMVLVSQEPCAVGVLDGGMPVLKLGEYRFGLLIRTSCDAMSDNPGVTSVRQALSLSAQSVTSADSRSIRLAVLLHYRLLFQPAEKPPVCVLKCPDKPGLATHNPYFIPKLYSERNMHSAASTGKRIFQVAPLGQPDGFFCLYEAKTANENRSLTANGIAYRNKCTIDLHCGSETVSGYHRTYVCRRTRMAVSYVLLFVFLYPEYFCVKGNQPVGEIPS